MKSKKTAVITIRIPEEAMEKLRDMATARGMLLSELMKEMINKKVEMIKEMENEKESQKPEPESEED